MWQDDMFKYHNVTYDDINCTIWQVTMYENDISLRTSIKFPWISINGKNNIVLDFKFNHATYTTEYIL